MRGLAAVIALLVLVGEARAQGSAAGAGSGSGSSAGAGAGSSDPGAGSAAPTIIQIPTDASAPTVSAEAAPTVVALGSPFTVFITATYEAGVEVNLREPVELGQGFEVRRKLSENRKTVDGRTTREWQLEVLPWEVGDIAIAPIAVTFTAYGKASQVESNAVRLKIVGVLGDLVDDPKALRDHAPPARLTVRDWFWLWIGGGAAVIGALLGIAVWTARRRRRRTVRLVGGGVGAPRQLDMTSVRALERLLEIEQRGALADADTRKAGYAEMVDVIREYLGARYHFATADLTSNEILRRLAPLASDIDLAQVDAWLAGCDLVKYGGLRTSLGDAALTLGEARAIVVTTSSTPAVMTEAA